MPQPELAVFGVGMISGAGRTALESCAAFRCGLNNFQETDLSDRSGTKFVGSPVDTGELYQGTERLAGLAVQAMRECLASDERTPLSAIPILLCVAEPERVGRLERLKEDLIAAIEDSLESRMHPDSSVIERGRVGGAVALFQARQILARGAVKRVMVVGVDTLLVEETLWAYQGEDRLLTEENSNGFIPGEAAAALVLGQWTAGSSAPLRLRGLGFATEPAAFGSGRPLRADGLVEAIRGALGEAQIALKDCDFRITDANGEQFWFKEAALAITRLLRDRKVLFSIWHPAECFGDVGAATLPSMVTMLFIAAQKDYLPGPIVLAHVGNDDGKRAAFIADTLLPQGMQLEVAAEIEVGAMKRRLS